MRTRPLIILTLLLLGHTGTAAGQGGEAPPYELDHAGRLAEVTEGAE